MVWAVSTLPQPPAPRCCPRGGWAGRGTECLHSMPVPGPAQLLPPAPAARTCERACCCSEPRSDRPRLAAPFPPCCLQHMPLACTRRALRASQTPGRAGGWEKINDLSRADRKRLVLPVGLAWVGSWAALGQAMAITCAQVAAWSWPLWASICVLAACCSCAKSELASPISLPPAPRGTTTVRRSHQGTSPLASGRPGGPVPPIGAAACGLGCVYTPQPPAPRCSGRRYSAQSGVAR